MKDIYWDYLMLIGIMLVFALLIWAAYLLYQYALQPHMNVTETADLLRICANQTGGCRMR